MIKSLVHIHAACFLVVIPMNGGDCRATEPIRRLILPDKPFNYSGDDWPEHIRQVAAEYDNTPSDNPVTDHGATLGRVLFYDTMLSANGKTSCASCHRQKLAFTDQKKVSVGFDGRKVKRNSMSLINSRFYPRGRFFWDERAATLEEQVLMPIENDIEMGQSLDVLIPELQADRSYQPLFENAFGDAQVTSKRIAKSLAQFIRSIVSCRSKYDRGRAEVQNVVDEFPNFTEQENYGKQQFFGRARCAECHLPEAKSAADDDKNLAPRQSAFFFLKEPAVNGVDSVTVGKDGGVGKISDRPGDLGRFKVPSLRNIEVTGPYMHDGRFATLDLVIEHYNWSVGPHPNLDQRLQDFSANGLALPEREKVALAAFLLTLTDPELLRDAKFSDPFVRDE